MSAADGYGLFSTILLAWASALLVFPEMGNARALKTWDWQQNGFHAFFMCLMDMLNYYLF